MNEIPFTENIDFPLDSTTMEALQNLSTEALRNAIIAIAGGFNCIISGVDKQQDDSYSDGIVIIDGKILSFKNSTGEYLSVEEKSHTVDYDGEERTVLIERYALAGNSGTLISSLPTVNMTKLKNELKEQLNGKLNIPGRPNSWAMNENLRKDIVLTSQHLYTSVNVNGFRIMRGDITVNFTPPEAVVNTWFTIKRIAGTLDGFTPINPAFSPAGVIFKGYKIDDNEEPFELYFRITRSDELQVYIPAQPIIPGVYWVNLILYNPNDGVFFTG